MLQIKPDNIIPITDARVKLDDLVSEAKGNNFFVISRQGKANAAIIDINYLMELQRRLELSEMNSINREFQKGFRTYLTKKGYDPDKIKEEEAEAILRRTVK